MNNYIYSLKHTTRFKKDYKLAKKRGLDLRLLEHVIDELLQGHTLDAKYLDHPLHGDYEGFNECHIQPDWLLIYGKDGAISFLLLLGQELMQTCSKTIKTA